MQITVLMEDTCTNPECEYEHGLSLYIEAEGYKILADTGASEKTIFNAGKLDVDLSKVDFAVLSHGHYDHSGGILAFRRINADAVIYMQRTALDDYYHGERYIGVDKQISQLPNIKLLAGNTEIDRNISIFTGITGKKFCPKSNLGLTRRVGGEDVQDDFAHEQCLVIRGDKTLLVSGCAHNGILNILDRYEGLYGGVPDVVISGFHMVKKTAYSEEEKEIILKTAEELRRSGAIYYTGHCTGQQAIDLMKPIMGDKLIQIQCGMRINLS
ncbi:MAG: MBL fold metallo-hydrolase [Lachnospiraceae bacterium]|nr:MBL fold metallo-hydrolase [Lachnospiraceae bacterium]